MNGLLKTNRSLCFSIKGEAIILQAGIPDGQGSTNFHEEDAFRPQKELEKFFEKEMSHLFYIDSVLTKRTTLDLSDMLGYIHISQSTLPSGYNHHELAVEYHKGLHERASNVFSELLADMKIKQKEQRLPYSLLIDDILKRA